MLKTFNSKYAALVMAFFAGASTALSFAPYSIWPIYPIALAFMLWRFPINPNKKVFRYWLSFGFGMFSFGISWVHVSMSTYGGIPLIASMGLMAILALYLAMYPAIAGALSQKIAPKNIICRNLLIFPSLWTLTEWLRGWILTGFPWLWAGYSQSEGPLRPFAAIIGTLGISFILAFLAGAIALAFQRKWRPLAMTLVVLTVCTLISPNISGIIKNDRSVNVALVQGNIPQSLKWQPEVLLPTLTRYLNLSLPEMKADIVIWPEAAIPAPEYMVQGFLNDINSMVNENHSALITGIVNYKNDKFYNSLIVLGDQKKSSDPQLTQTALNQSSTSHHEYYKHHLLPIGEFVPFENILRPIAPLFNLPQSSFSRGDYIQPNLTALGYHIAAAICYEIAFPEQVRDNTHHNTDMLLTVSNDAWFGHSNGPLQHMEIAKMRAVEMGRPLIRATNNGITAIVDYRGNIVKSLPQFTAGVLTDNVQLVAGITPFKRWGEWPILAISLLLVCVGIIGSKLKK